MSGFPFMGGAVPYHPPAQVTVEGPTSTQAASTQQNQNTYYNPTTGQYDAITQDMASLFGANPAPAFIQAFTDEAQAFSGRQNDPTLMSEMKAMEFPGGGYRNNTWDPTGITGIGPAQFSHINLLAWQQTVSAAENWAATVGWKYFPSLVALYNAYQQGLYTDPQSLASYFTNTSVVPQDRTKVPWATTGMTPQQWRDQQNSFLDAVQVYTGNRNIPNQSIFNQAMSEKWSVQRLTNTLLNDPSFQNRYGWTKYGYTYQSFQQYKLSNKNAIAQRYGAGAVNSDAAYLSDLANPLQAIHASGGAVDTSKFLQTHNLGMSQVR